MSRPSHEEFDFDAWLVPLVRTLVPARRRADWSREWQAELWHLRHQDSVVTRKSRKTPGYLRTTLSLGWGLLADAAWLRWDWLRQSAPGSAEWCLIVLFACCLLCACVDRMLAVSWHSAAQTLAAHLLHSYAFVAVPAIFAAIVTYPLKELRWQRKEARFSRWLSARSRWNAFLAAKVILTLTLAFLATATVSVALRDLLYNSPAGLPGNWHQTMTDNSLAWFELLISAPLATLGLRWALLNQEQRCQKCLRMLSQPTRLGPPSHNFLHWSGTELACADGHGFLHVPEMQGSWCWCDRWVELDPVWNEVAFS